MKKRFATQLIMIAALSPFALACSAIGHSTSSTGATDTPTNSDESNVEASYSTAVSFLGASNSSSSDANTSVATLTTATLATGGTSNVRQRFRCSETTAEDGVTLTADEDFECHNSTGILTRTITFTECVVSNDQRTATLNGAFTNSVANGGEGLCNDNQTFDFGNMVMGRDDADAVHQDATHSHQTAESGLVFSFTNDGGKAVTLTQTANTTRTFTDPVDADADGIAESVNVTIERNDSFIHEIEGTEVHDLTAFTSDSDFTSTDADGLETTVELSLPVHAITIDEDGEIETNSIVSGSFVVDHNLAKIRTVVSVGADGLTFNNEGDCSPQDGSVTTTAYTINDDSTIGAQIGTGTIVFVDGEVEDSTFDGADVDVRPLPCN